MILSKNKAIAKSNAHDSQSVNNSSIASAKRRQARSAGDSVAQPSARPARVKRDGTTGTQAERSGARAERHRRGALGNTRVAFPVSPSKRAQRWQMRDGLREVTTLKRARKCGKVPVAPLISLRANADGSRAGFGGLAVCGSVWVCPVCSAKIASRRKSELEEVLQHATKHGYKVSMLTLTQRHNKGQRLKALWDGLSFAWNRVTSGRRWIEFKEQLGLVGYVRATEVTHGKHGWHVHSHILIISEKDPTITPIFWKRRQGRRRTPYPVEMIMPSDFVADRWESGLARHDIAFIKDKGGLDWEIARDAQAMVKYVAKMQTNGNDKPKSNTDAISSEATLGGFKKARGENRTPFQILADIIEYGDVDDVEIWHEYEQSSHGRRALTWSKGLREWANLGKELTDEEIAEEELGDETIATFDHDAWREVQRAGAPQLLDVTEAKGVQGAIDWLNAHQIEWNPPERKSTAKKPTP